MGPEIKNVSGQDDVRSFFNHVAREYKDQHGSPKKLLEYRLSLICKLLGSCKKNSLLEVGCGTGIHLFELASDFNLVLGTDLSPIMIEKAIQHRKHCANKDKINLAVDPAEHLSTVSDNQISVVICIGAFEHMLDKAAVLRQIYRVMEPGGVFVCLTPNGEYVWYRWIANWLGFNVRHLSTDSFLTADQLLDLVQSAGYCRPEIDYWSFIPKGDVGICVATFLEVFDKIGKVLRISSFRGGIHFKAVKPVS